jgi:Cu2+-exporting ATPase
MPALLSAAYPAELAAVPPGVRLLDDPSGQAGFTTWEQLPDGRRVGLSYFQMSGLYCAACTSTIEAALQRVPGMIEARVSAGTGRASIRWDAALTRPSQLVEAVERAGYGAVPDVAGSARTLRLQTQRHALWRLFVAVFCMMQVMMYATPLYIAEPGTVAPDMQRLLLWASWLLSVPVLVFSAGPFFQDAWRSLRQGQIGMDVPVSLGIAVTFVVSSGAMFEPGGVFGHEVYFDSMTMFVSFLLIGRYLELKARHRVAAALEGAVSRLPESARRIDGHGAIAVVALAELRTGDAVRVLRGEAFPADGRIFDGHTEADEALLTGESRPVAKAPGDAVLAGSLNLQAPVSLRVERLGAQTRYEGIVALMRGALTQRPQVLRAADRIAKPFLWGVLLLALGAAAVWSQIDPGRAVWVMVSVLIVTCPCALSLAAPSALLAAAGALAKRGVLVQRLDALEALVGIDQLFFDKTGTLTEDRLEVERVEWLPAASTLSLDEASWLALAGSLAAQSSHPLSRALSRALAAHAQGEATVWSGVEDHPGFGLQATAPRGGRYRLGARAWVESGGPAGSSGADAATTVTAAPTADTEVWFGDDDGGALARFRFAEALRPDAAATVQALHDAGLSVALLSGDSPARVEALAQRLHIADAQGGATPEAKLLRISAAQGAGQRVGMVGDGLNDAPVIARADVSFAMGQGAAVTRSKADFILLSGRLSDVLVARDTARHAMRVVRQNLGWALVYNAVCVPLALVGLFPPWAAGLGMAASSLGVVLNALRVAAPRSPRG